MNGHVDNLSADVLNITSGIRRDPHYPYAIGCGAAGDVHRAIFEWGDPVTSQRYSMKVVVKVFQSTGLSQEKITERIKREVAAWRYLDHPNVSKFLGIASLFEGRPPGLVSAYMLRNDFLSYVARHPELKMQKAQEVALGLQYLHSRGVIHGDVKVANVLVTDQGVAQINDFGVSQIIGIKGFTTKILGNIRHNAPELMPIEEVKYAVKPTTQTDIFSFGILLLLLFHGQDRDTQSGLPYNHVRLRASDGHELRLLRLIHAGERPIRERYRPISDHHWALICRCWDGNPAFRPDINEVLVAI